MSTELAVVRAFMLLGKSPSSGVEAFLGNDLDPLVAVLGFNPGLNGAPHSRMLRRRCGLGESDSSGNG
jgi:hypothetical protein